MIHQCEARRCDVKLFKISTVGKQLSNRTATEKRNVNCVTSGKITNMVVHLEKKLYSFRALSTVVLVSGIKETHVTADFLWWLQAAV